MCLKQRVYLAKQHNWRCWYCHCIMRKEYGWQDSVTIEHVVPLSRGGVNAFWNRVAACHRCNFNRGTMDADEFAAIAKHYKPDTRPIEQFMIEHKRKNLLAKRERMQATQCPARQPLRWWERAMVLLSWYVLPVMV